jgi:hypothetical protein
VVVVVVVMMMKMTTTATTTTMMMMMMILRLYLRTRSQKSTVLAKFEVVAVNTEILDP